MKISAHASLRAGAALAALADSNIPVVVEAPNITANIYNNKIIALLWRRLEGKDEIIEKLQQRIEMLEGLLNPLHTRGTAEHSAS